MKIYYNSRCSKCRVAKTFLEDNNIKFEIINYLESGVSKKDLKNILKNGNLNILDILRKNEEEYKLYVKNKNLSDKDIIGLIHKYPKLLQRPIVFDELRAVIARDEESLNKIKTWK